MKLFKLNLLTALFLNLTCFSLEANTQNFSTLNSETFFNLLTDKTNVPDLLKIDEIKIKATPQNNKQRQLKRTQENFAEFILFLSLTLPTLNDRRASLDTMQNIGKRFTRPLFKNLQKYKPSRNRNNRNQALQKFKTTANRLITNEARGLILNNLNNPRLRKKIKKDFSTLLNIWNKNIHSIKVNQIKKDFSAILSINNTFNRNRFNYNGAIYKRLTNLIDNITNEIQN